MVALLPGKFGKANSQGLIPGAILANARRNGDERNTIMMLAHIFGLHGRGFGGGILLILIVLACAVIIATWPSKSEPK